MSEEKIKNIKGPISFRLFSKNDKKIYIFGDIHTKFNIDCPSSQNIVDVLKAINKKFTLFLEAGECNEEKKELKTYICEINQKVKSTDTRTVKYSDARHLYFDFFLEGLYAFINGLDTFVKRAEQVNYDMSKLSDEEINLYISKMMSGFQTYVDNIENTSKFISNATFGITKMELYNNIINLEKENNELYILLLTFLKQMRENTINEEKNNNTDYLLNIWGDLLVKYLRKTSKNQRPSINLNIWKEKLQKSKNYIKGLMSYYALLSGFYMDVYLLYYLLHNNPNDNNVVYAGEVHCTHYKQVLEKYGYKLEFETISPPDLAQCVSTNNIKLPLFS